MNSELPKRKLSIEEIVNLRHRILEKYFNAFESIKEAWELQLQLGEMSSIEFKIADQLAYNTHHIPRIKEEVVKKLDYKIWNFIGKESGLYSLMDDESKRKFYQEIQKSPMPITLENVKSKMGEFGQEKESIFIRGILNVFEGLSKDLVTNDSFRLGKKVIIQGGLFSRGEEKISDIERIFFLLDKKRPPEYSHSVASYIRSSQIDRVPGEIDTAYLHVKTFLNRKYHVTFKRSELVDRVNKIIARHFKLKLGNRTESKRWRNSTTH